MKTINLNVLLNLSYLAFVAHKYNKYNLSSFYEYNDFLKKIDSKKTIEEITGKKVTTYLIRLERMQAIIFEFITSISKQKEMQIDLSYDDIPLKKVINYLNDINDKNKTLQNETFELSDEAYQTFKDLFLFTYKCIKERDEYLVPKNEIISHINKIHHEKFDRLHYHISGEMLTDNIDDSVNVIKNFFYI